MNLLIIGAKGQLGIDLMARAQQHGWHTTGVDLPECDITSQKSLEQIFEQAGSVAAVINAAAYTAVDQAESEAEAAYAVNRDGPENLAQLCRQKGVPLVHISTDYVFKGMQTRPYRPSDLIDPMGVYGQSKADGELAVRENCVQHVIVRTSWLFGLHGSNFVKTMLRLGKEREVVKVVDDQIGSPTYACDLADALIKVAAHVTQHQTGWGTHHFCNAGALTWYAFARKIMALARSHEHLRVKEVIPILAAHYPTPAPRPHYSVLDCSSLEQTFAVSRRPWESALQEMLTALYALKT